MALQFEWDRREAAANRRKHNVSFEGAATAFADLRSVTIPDPDHSEQEERLVLPGRSHRDRILVVVPVERGDYVRIISARKAKRRERLQ